ncbi:hypothetical protein HanXRQr2_Chr02g0073101 [Helianthus annuus]|uniref:Uncharacterized protein n=1 Tax=Helianthus annuus TaxID=4232 RepID=A0A9K3P1M4_HELAN|nr:hypothetical protein HanXRQr2_Chr02g0073101 [Helianthus annuus]
MRGLKFLRILFVRFNGSVITRRSQILVTIKIHKLSFLKFIQFANLHLCTSGAAKDSN